jgi:hypothetical protein
MNIEASSIFIDPGNFQPYARARCKGEPNSKSLSRCRTPPSRWCASAQAAKIAVTLKRSGEEINRYRNGDREHHAADSVTDRRQRADRHCDMPQIEEHGAAAAGRHRSWLRGAHTMLVSAVHGCMAM